MLTLLDQVYKAARKVSVSFSLHYDECDDSWHFSVHSIAPSENWIGKGGRSFPTAAEYVLGHLASLTASRGA